MLILKEGRDSFKSCKLADDSIIFDKSATAHFLDSRQDRANLIKEIGIGDYEVDRFEVDKGHPNGPEIHIITDNAIIIIYNRDSKRLVTMLIARPAQIDRYYEWIGEYPPQDIMQKAREHQSAGLNLM